MRSDYESMSEAEAMSELARLMWERYFKPRASEELLNHSLDGYKSQVVTNNNDGTLTVMRPFDNTYLTLKCPPALAESAQPGDQVLVINLGDASNSFILCGTDMSGFGEGGGGNQFRPISFDFSDIEDGYFTEVVEDEEGNQVTTIYDVTFDANGRIDTVTSRSDNWETTVAWGAYEKLPASDVSYDNTGSGLSADTAQGAIDELFEEKANQSQLAYIESGSTASRAYAVGEYFCWSGLLYRAKTAIASGASFTVGTNCEAVSSGGLNDLNSKTVQFKSISATAGQTVTITTTLGICSLLMSVSGSTDVRTGLYALQGWSTGVSDRIATPINAASSITISGINSGWSIATGTGTRTFVFIVLSGEINTLSAS